MEDQFFKLDNNSRARLITRSKYGYGMVANIVAEWIGNLITKSIGDSGAEGVVPCNPALIKFAIQQIGYTRIKVCSIYNNLEPQYVDKFRKVTGLSTEYVHDMSVVECLFAEHGYDANVGFKLPCGRAIYTSIYPYLDTLKAHDSAVYVRILKSIPSAYFRNLKDSRSLVRNMFPYLIDMMEYHSDDNCTIIREVVFSSFGYTNNKHIEHIENSIGLERLLETDVKDSSKFILKLITSRPTVSDLSYLIVPRELRDFDARQSSTPPDGDYKVTDNYIALDESIKVWNILRNSEHSIIDSVASLKIPYYSSLRRAINADELECCNPTKTINRMSLEDLVLTDPHPIIWKILEETPDHNELSILTDFISSDGIKTLTTLQIIALRDNILGADIFRRWIDHMYSHYVPEKASTTSTHNIPLDHKLVDDRLSTWAVKAINVYNALPAEHKESFLVGLWITSFIPAIRNIFIEFILQSGTLDYKLYELLLLLSPWADRYRGYRGSGDSADDSYWSFEAFILDGHTKIVQSEMAEYYNPYTTLAKLGTQQSNTSWPPISYAEATSLIQYLDISRELRVSYS